MSRVKTTMSRMTSLPKTEDPTDFLYGATWFLPLDLQSGYWQKVGGQSGTPSQQKKEGPGIHPVPVKKAKVSPMTAAKPTSF
ncbi:hypothetical protein Pmani_006766 [Petrolisthes manimaculis]|uniref:Uncharacterized protein n=1 Tax=Petrolisthes manimaculis TaxID=1843537 RepID=A0AAE1Q9L0_9EUCA|nr:hypothetical protein Pmani_006766 [Petrolisthes manimaculis]